MIALRRHALARLAEAPEADGDDDVRRAAGWHAAGRPFVVTRRRDADAAVGLGFCTTDPAHLELRPRRVAARTGMDSIVSIAPPPMLGDIAAIPEAAVHAASFAHLGKAATAAGIEIRVYGSWMWQALTGERHVHRTSDLDILVEVTGTAAADRAAAFLRRVEPSLAFRLDGELSFSGRGEVNWREYAQDRTDVLLKSIDTMRLTPRGELPA